MERKNSFLFRKITLPKLESNSLRRNITPKASLDTLKRARDFANGSHEESRISLQTESFNFIRGSKTSKNLGEFNRAQTSLLKSLNVDTFEEAPKPP